MQIYPLKSKYYCQIITDAKQLPSGIWIAENAHEVPHRAKVLACGKDCSAKVGEIIHFKRVWHRQPLGGETIFVKEEEVVGVECK